MLGSFFFNDFGVEIFFSRVVFGDLMGFLVFRAWLLISVTGFVWIGRFSVCRLVADGMDLIRVLDKRCFHISVTVLFQIDFFCIY